MTESQENTKIEGPDELSLLKERADKMGIPYHPSIGVVKLRDKVNTILNSTPPETTPEPEVTPAVRSTAPATPVVESKAAKRTRLKREANRLIRIRLTCMDPNKKDWPGEIFTVGNAVVGTFKKFVPFNADEGWHVPYIIYKQLKERQCQVFVKAIVAGRPIMKGKLINAFAIEKLPPLTTAERMAMKQNYGVAGDPNS